MNSGEFQVAVKTKRMNKWVIPAYMNSYKWGLLFLLPLLERVPIMKVTTGKGQKKITSIVRLGKVVKYQR